MRDIDQFIDEVLFKESDQYKLIYETVLKELDDEQKKGNLGNAAELIAYASLCKKIRDTLKEENVDCSPLPEVALEAAKKFISSDSDATFEMLQKEANNHAEFLFSQLFFRREYFGKNIKPVSANVKFIGTSEAGKTAGDVEVKFVSDSPEYKVNTFKASLKRKNKLFYQSGKFSTDEKTLNLLKGRYSAGIPASPDIELIKKSGGGLIKIIKLFGAKRNKSIEDAIKEKNNNISEIYSDLRIGKKNTSELENSFKTYRDQRDSLIVDYMGYFYLYLQEQLTNETDNKDKIQNLINLFYNLLVRGDPEVTVFSDLYSFRQVKSQKQEKSNYNILFTPLMNVYVGHIKSVSVKSGFEERSPYINFFIKDVDKFENVFAKENKTLNVNIKNLLIELRKEINASLEGSKSFIGKEKRNQKFETINDLLTIFGINKQYFSSDAEIELSRLFQDLVNNANKVIESLQNKNIFKIQYKIFKKELTIKKKYESGRTEVSAMSDGFNSFIKFLNDLYYLENSDYAEVQKIISIIKEVLSAAKEGRFEDKQLSFYLKESLHTIIKEALDEKEFEKVMKKVMSSKADGLISAIPSNKTNNSIAVRFDDDEKIDSGIKKIKSSLKSSGYELESNRVLKFDQDRDTIDILKNGQVVGRLFFRADIKERQGLAYEHIIGSMLTGKVTDQLKNRIDLSPDASIEQVKEKLSSEKFKHLYDSAKKAAPIIIKKVGKIVKAESVGSTNNKADFILTTADGKTVGLSAKYAAGEKDNEYKMNKVLGFGTEDESLVYNPKAVPWWVVGRQTFLEKLKQQTGAFKDKNYDPDYETLDAPAWMKSAKEKHPDVYKETMEEVYGQIRNILTRNLRRMKFKDLVSFVMEADLGKEEERGNYDKFIKVVDGPSGLSVTEVSMDSDGSDIDPKQLNPEEVVVQDRSDIIIKIP